MLQIFIDGVEVVSVPATAKRFGVSVKTIYEWLKAKELRSLTHETRRYIVLSTIKELESKRNER